MGEHLDSSQGSAMNNAALVNLDILGPAAPTGSELGRIAGAALHLPPVEIGFANAAPIQVPLFNMTTGGLWRITGTAQMDGSAVPGKSVPFSVVVKSIQSPALWSGIWQVPDHFRESLVRNYPWHTEARVYASDLANNMPDGGRLRPYGDLRQCLGESVSCRVVANTVRSSRPRPLSW